MSTERLDVRPVNGNGKPPVEKRVQWAIDSPKKAASPTTSDRSSPTGPTRISPLSANQPARIAIPPGVNGATSRQSPVTVTSRPPTIPDAPSWSRVLHEPLNAPSLIPTRFQQEDQQRMKLWKQSEMRRFRDEEIASLESRHPQLAPNEQERLRILRLERDFERRVGENRHGHDDDEPDEEDDEDDGEEDVHERLAQPPVRMPLVKPTPHLHHPTAASRPEMYKTTQQEDYDSFVRRHEVHAVNEAIRRSREHLDKVQTVRLQEPQVQQQTYSLPEISRHSTSPPHKSSPEHHRLSAGAEIRREVEAARQQPSGGSASVVGVYEVYNDPRNRILNAKVKLPVVGTDGSPEKLSFRDKMKMFAMTVGEEDPGDKVMNSSKQREIDYSNDDY